MPFKTLMSFRKNPSLHLEWEAVSETNSPAVLSGGLSFNSSHICYHHRKQEKLYQQSVFVNICEMLNYHQSPFVKCSSSYFSSADSIVTLVWFFSAVLVFLRSSCRKMLSFASLSDLLLILLNKSLSLHRFLHSQTDRLTSKRQAG